jgi:hypothetical protein
MIGTMETLEEAYHEVERNLSSHIEPLESVHLVEEYRRYWKPEKVRVILLAESHVFTSDEDRRIVIPQIDDLPGYPTRYARFVYCLGYGEKTLTKNPHHPQRDGTPQFWKLLHCCNNPILPLKDFWHVQGRTPSRQRLRNKIALLKNLKAKGIWLVDASIVALYREGEKNPKMAEVLRKSWESYTRQVITSASPEHVICVGKGVASIVEDDLRDLFPGRYTVISQPNARRHVKESLEDFRKKQMENFQMYYKICNP